MPKEWGRQKMGARKEGKLGGYVKPFGPAGIGGAVAEHAPGGTFGGGGHGMQTPTELGWRFVTLGLVSPGAGREHNFPLVTTSPASGHATAPALCASTATGTPPAVPGAD